MIHINRSVTVAALTTATAIFFATSAIQRFYAAFFSFLSRVSILLLTRDIDIVILSVCPSVCP